MDWKRTQEVKKALEQRGYAATYLDSWQPKVDMWWHRDWLNVEGAVIKPRGTIVPTMPGHPDHQMRMSVRGLTQAQVDEGYLSLLPWAPGPTCKCRTCREAEVGHQGVTTDPGRLRCDFPGCNYVPTGTVKQQPFRLNMHKKSHSKAAVNAAEAVPA